jgi:3-dehydroquinate dehydratase-1
MQKLNGDITKIAVMPQSYQDVFILLEAASLMKASYADRPYLTISMSSKGTASRICCELYGSCITFGSGAQASAPGQINASDLKTILSLIHKSIG